MGIQRATVLFPVNTTTVDTGGGIDIRLLDSAEAGANDDTQTVQWTHLQDSNGRVFDPATAAVTLAKNVGTTPTTGWALRLAEDMTPADDANCNAILPAGTLTVSMNVALNQSGGTYVTGSYGPDFKAALWRYNPSTNTGTSLGVNGTAGTTWDYTPVTGDLGTFKVVTFNYNIASLVEFAAGEILLLELGLNTSTVPNPTLGTATWVATLRVDNADTKITWAAGQSIKQACVLSLTTNGKGVSTQSGSAITMSRSATGKGLVTNTNAVIASKSFSVIGKGVVTITKSTQVFRTFSLVGIGTPTMTRVVVAAKSFTLDGRGTVTRQMSLTMARTAIGKGVPTMTKTTIASKTFSLIGKGIITEIHPVQAYRTFNLVGIGTILTTGANATTITIPIDEVPTGTGGDTIVISPIFNVFD